MCISQVIKYIEIVKAPLWKNVLRGSNSSPVSPLATQQEEIVTRK